MNSRQTTNFLSGCIRLGLMVFAGAVCFPANRSLAAAPPEQVLKGVEEKLAPEEKARRERMRVSAGGFASFQLSDDGKLVLLSLSGRLYALNRASAAVRMSNRVEQVFESEGSGWAGGRRSRDGES